MILKRLFISKRGGLPEGRENSQLNQNLHYQMKLPTLSTPEASQITQLQAAVFNQPLICLKKRKLYFYEPIKLSYILNSLFTDSVVKIIF